MWLQTFTKSNSELHQNFTGSYKKAYRYWINCKTHRILKGKKENTLRWKLFDQHQIGFKNRLDWANKKHTIITQMSWWGWAPVLLHVRKIFNCKVSFKFRCQGASQLLRKNFEHSCDQLFLEWHFRKKIYHNSNGFRSHPLFLSYCYFSTKNKNESTEYHDTFISFKSHLHLKQESPSFLLFSHGVWYVSPCLG